LPPTPPRKGEGSARVAEPSVLDLKFACSWDPAQSEPKKHTRNKYLLVSSSIPKFVRACHKRIRTSESGH